MFGFSLKPCRVSTTFAFLLIILCSQTNADESSLVRHFYKSFLGREPDESGGLFWQQALRNFTRLGANPVAVATALFENFLASDEWLNSNVADESFVDRIYLAAYNGTYVPASDPGRQYWLAKLASGTPRNIVSLYFTSSSEFSDFVTASGISTATPTRPECDQVLRFYSAYLRRVPDVEGYVFYVNQFRDRMCLPPQIRAKEITDFMIMVSSYFFSLGEYSILHRPGSRLGEFSDSFITDLFNGALLRPIDSYCYQFWTRKLKSGELSWEQVLHRITQSPEFASQLQRLISADCIQDRISSL